MQYNTEGLANIMRQVQEIRRISIQQENTLSLLFENNMSL